MASYSLKHIDRLNIYLCKVFYKVIGFKSTITMTTMRKFDL